MNVASNATLALIPSGNSSTFGGTFTGSGGGQVLFNTGTLNAAANGVAFDLPYPLFQWNGGTISGAVQQSRLHDGFAGNQFWRERGLYE